MMIFLVLLLKPTKSVLNGKEIDLTSDDINIKSKNFNVDKDGDMSCNNATVRNANIIGGNIEMTGNDTTPTIKITDYSQNGLEMYPSNFWMSYDYAGDIVSQYLQKSGYYVENESTGQSTSVDYYGITTPTLTQTSKAEVKKNFEKLENALDIVKATEIYKYNLKNEEDTTKKHIGFVIGDNYNYSKEITSKNNDGVDIYSMVSVCMKAIQEQQEQIEILKQEIKELKGGK